MVNPAIQLSAKIPDKKLQVWATSLLAGEGEGEGEGEGGLYIVTMLYIDL